MDLMNSTLRNLNDRTNTIYEALEAIDKKHSRLEKEFLNNIDFIHELRDRAQELISRQKQLEKGFKDFDANSLVGNFTSKSKNHSGVSNGEISASRSLPKQQPLRESYSNRGESTEEKNSQILSDEYDSDNDSTQKKQPKASPKSNYHDEEEDDVEEKEDIEKGKLPYTDDADEYTPDEDRRSEDLSNEYNVKEIDNIEPNNRNFDDSEEERLREEEEEERLWEEEQKRKEEERRLRKLQEENDFEDEYASREGVNSDEDKEGEFLEEDQEEMRIREKIERMKQEELDLMQQEE